jgi:hypothetical protein
MSDSVDVAVPATGADVPSSDAAPVAAPDASTQEAAPATAAPELPLGGTPDALSAKKDDAAQPEDAKSEPPGKTPAFLQLLSDTVGDDTTDLDEFVGSLKQKHIESLTPEGRQIIKNMLRAFKTESGRISEHVTQRETQLKNEAKALDNRARGLHAQRSALLKMLQRPDLIAKASQDAVSDDDLLTPEGQRKHLEQLVAKNWKESLGELEQTTQAEARSIAFQQWASDKPEMKDPVFTKDMRDMIESRARLDLKLGTADAYELVKARRGVKAAGDARARENAVRAAAARQIGTGSGAAEKPKAPPKKGGARAIANFLKANPDYKYRGRNARK